MGLCDLLSVGAWLTSAIDQLANPLLAMREFFYGFAQG